MSRRYGAEADERRPRWWAELVGAAVGRTGRFRDSRLYAQAMISLGLVAVTALTVVWPAGPLARVRHALAWTATSDYDFQGSALRADRWARDRGGWAAAAGGVWSGASARLRRWVPGAPGKPAGPAADTAAKPAADTGGKPGTVPAGGAGGGGGGGAQPGARPRAIMPVKGAVLYGFGWLPKNQQQVHAGLDLSAIVDEDVLAIADGRVTRVGGDTAMGTFVEVDHGFCVAVYGQVHNLKVKSGDQLKQGQPLANIARATGREGAAQAHLHFEAWVDGKAIDPMQFLPIVPQGGSET